MKLKNTLVFISLLFLSSCGLSEPSLCDCLTNPEYSSGSKLESCKNVFQKNYGTRNPSTGQMSSDYYNCN